MGVKKMLRNMLRRSQRHQAHHHRTLYFLKGRLESALTNAAARNRNDDTAKSGLYLLATRTEELRRQDQFIKDSGKGEPGPND